MLVHLGVFGEQGEGTVQWPVRLVSATGGSVAEREHHQRGMSQTAVSDAAGMTQGLDRELGTRSRCTSWTESPASAIRIGTAAR